jgi:glycosyltransferase involved in cell wall biosynthesis
MPKLSICIPTYNRSKYLLNCLNSILIAKRMSNLNFEVCISDNKSNEKILPIINRFKKRYKIVFKKNKKNIGIAKNIIQSVSMAKGEFVWILGNDDLVLPNTFKTLEKLFSENSDVEFYYINTFNIENNFIKKNSIPLNTKKINFSKFKKLSNYKISKKKNFFELINPFISFEFLLSMNLCIFKRIYWIKNTNKIDKKNLNDERLYSNFDNTAPHVKIWSAAFNNKKSYFFAKPLSANIHGPRTDDWGSHYPLVEGIRIPEALECYRKSGMSLSRYYLCKSFALRRFIPAIFKILFNRNYYGLQYISISKNISNLLLYPSTYFFAIYFLLKKIALIIKN